MSENAKSKPTLREAAKAQRRAALKPALDSPFTVRWPNIPDAASNQILQALLEALAPVTQYNQHKMASIRPRNRKTRQNKADFIAASAITDNRVPPLPEAPPALLGHLVVGINAVSKAVQNSSSTRHSQLHLPNKKRKRDEPETIPTEPQSNTEALPTLPNIEYVFVCKQEINPPDLVQHFPTMIAASNGLAKALNEQQVETSKLPQAYLIPLGSQAEAKLSQAVGLPRVAALAIKSKADIGGKLPELIQHYVTPLETSWLQFTAVKTPAQHQAAYIPTHIKLLQTSVPTDMKAHKDMKRTKRKLQAEKEKK